MAIYEKMNEYLSNLAVLNVKLHNLHWNVVGLQFVQVHEFTESIYDDFFEKFDAVAELLKMKSEKPLVRMVDYLEKASIKEIDKDKFSTAEVLDILKEDLGKMRELATEIRNLADEAGDFVTVAEFEGHVEGYNKNLWFIEAMLTQ
ncbi:MAG: DNA starvation/stationary phase protection protein [Tissierellia bacterium]|jgi:starvation-inducible DNA-binding protein|nr:DNA starvation/stationary phase protection protein [Tissierellia bacterium]